MRTWTRASSTRGRQHQPRPRSRAARTEPRRRPGAFRLRVGAALALTLIVSTAGCSAKSPADAGAQASPAAPGATTSPFVPPPTSFPPVESPDAGQSTPTPSSSASPTASVKTNDSLVATLDALSPDDFADFPREKQIQYVVWQYWKENNTADYLDWLDYSIAKNDGSDSSGGAGNNDDDLYHFNPIDIAAEDNTNREIYLQSIYARQFVIALAEANPSSKYNDGLKMLAGYLYNANAQESNTYKIYARAADRYHAKADGSAHTYTPAKDKVLSDESSSNDRQLRRTFKTSSFVPFSDGTSKQLRFKDTYVWQPYALAFTVPGTGEVQQLSSGLWLLERSDPTK